jgi:prolipoprotein diacylglyceryltransferase
VLPDVFDVRLIPVAYGIGFVGGVLFAVVQSLRRGTALADESRELPLLTGLLLALVYLAYLAGRLLSVS